MATINPAMAHKPCNREYELYPALLVNSFMVLLWMMIGYAVAISVYVQNKFKPFQALGLEERRYEMQGIPVDHKLVSSVIMIILCSGFGFSSFIAGIMIPHPVPFILGALLIVGFFYEVYKLWVMYKS